MSHQVFCFQTVVAESLRMLSGVIHTLREGKPEALTEAKRVVHTLKGNFAYFSREDVMVEVVELENFFCDCSSTLFTTSMRYLAVEKTHNLYWNLSIFTQESELQHDSIGDDYYPIGKAMVDDLAVRLNKKISFSIKGGETQLPSGNWDEVFTYFTHFLRNSADHGLESEVERLSKGKKAEGKIEISFFIKHSFVEIHLSDDGRGVKWKEIAASENEAFKKLFEDGYSTRKIITAESGLGVGLSALNALVQRRKGIFSYKNIPGRGLTLVLVLPSSPNIEIKRAA